MNGDGNVLQNMLIFILLGVVFILLTPVVTNIIKKSQNDSILTSAETTVTYVQSLYMSLNMTDQVDLPFTVEYTGATQKIYSNGVLLEGVKYETKGRIPRSGKITINTDQTITAENLVFSDTYLCNKTSGKGIECTSQTS